MTKTIPKTSENKRKSKIQSKYSRGRIKTKKLKNHLLTHISTGKFIFSKQFNTLELEMERSFLSAKFKNFKTGKSFA